MLSSITIKNFKSYENAMLELSPLTVLIGANASGKSNAIEALRLLSWIAQGNRLDSNPFTINGRRRIRGNVGQLGYRDEKHFSFECRTTYPRWDTYSITLSSHYDEFRISKEALAGGSEKTPLFEVRFWEEQKERELRVGVKGAAPNETPFEASFTDQMAVLIQVQNLPRVGESPAHAEDLRSTAALYEQWLSRIVFLDAQPAAMRGYSSRHPRWPASDGSNLAGVLYNLCKNASAKAELLEIISILPEQDIRDVRFIELPNDAVTLRLTETFGGTNTDTDVALLSDGTLRVLAAATAVLWAPEGGLVVVEELDAGVHPSRAEKLLGALSSAAKRRNVRILTTSHDPALLDAVPDEALGGIVFCYRDPETGSSRLIRLRDLPNYPELTAQGPVGRLLTRGIIERSAKDRTSPEERRQRALSWLEDLRATAG